MQLNCNKTQTILIDDGLKFDLNPELQLISMKAIYLIICSSFFLACSSCGRYQKSKNCKSCTYKSYGTEIDAGTFCDDELMEVEDQGYSSGGAYNDVECYYPEEN